MNSVLALLPLIAFLLLAFALAFYARRQGAKQAQDQKGEPASKADGFVQEYFIGNRSLGSFVLAMTTIATYGSVSSFVGGPGQAWSIGWGWVYMATVQVTSMFLLYGILGKKMALVGKRTNSVTIIDLIRARYRSDALAVVSAVVILVFFSATMVAQFVGGAKIFEAVTGQSYIVGLVIFGVFSVVFTVIGGFRGVAFTDVLCGVVMLIGIGIIAGGILIHGGGLEGITTHISTAHPEMNDPFSGGNMPGGLYFTQWLLVGVLTLCLPQSAVRTLSARDARSQDRALFRGTIIVGFMMIGVTALGTLAAGVLTGPLSDYGGTVDDIMPAVILQCLPDWLASIAVAGSLAASISTVSSLLIACSSAIVKDLWLHKRTSGAAASAAASGGASSDEARAGASVSLNSPTQDVKVKHLEGASQLITLVIGLIVFVLAIVPFDVIWKLNMFAFGGLETAFSCVLLFGLFWKRATPTGALVSTGAGTLAYCVSMACGFKLFGLHQIVIGLIVAVVSMVVVSLLTKPCDKTVLADFFPAE